MKRQHKYVTILCLLVWPALLFPPCQAAEPSGEDLRGSSAGLEQETLEMLSGYLHQAASQNPELESAFYRWKAALERIPQVKALPDPRFTFAYYIRNVETRVGPQQARLALFQTFPWFGVLGLKEDMAVQEANAGKAQYDALKFKIFYEVKEAFYEYAYLGQAIQVAEQDIQLLQYFEIVARARYASGAAPYADVLNTQVQLGRLEDRLRSLRDLRKPLAARLAAAVNAPPDTPFPWPPTIPVMLLSAGEEEIIRQIPEDNPQLKRYEHLEARERAAIELARKDFYPDITFGIEDIITGSSRVPNVSDSGKDAIIASVTINIPLWWEKQKAAVREGRARLASVSKGAESLKRSILSSVELALYNYRDSQRRIDLYLNTLLPKAEESLEVTLQAYQAGVRTSLDLIDAEKTLLEFELAYIRALADQAQRFAELEMLLGKEIPCQIHGAVLPRHGANPLDGG